jgi:hypothetical protein
VGKWIEAADRKTSCARCHAVIEVGQRFWFQRRGTYFCELDGSLAEHEEPEVGEHESGVLEDLKQLPPEASDRTLAKAMIGIAKRLDSGDVADRDLAPLILQIRALLTQLRDLYPPEPEDDDTEKARKRRERRLVRDGDFDE